MSSDTLNGNSSGGGSPGGGSPGGSPGGPPGGGGSPGGSPGGSGSPGGGSLRDEPARRQIVEDLDTCILVEAGAGSGKTSCLAARMVALLREGRAPAENMAAITFTRKAALELRGRFQMELEQAFARETDDLKRERLSRGLDELDRCFLGTIHSFCASILRERPVEADLEPDFGELDDLDDALLLERAWDEHLASVQGSRPELLDRLRELDVEMQDLRDCYKALSTYPDVSVVSEHVPRPDLAAVRKHLYGLLDWAKDMIPEEVPERGWDGLQELLRTAFHRRRVFDLDDDLILMRFLADLDRAGGITQNRWYSREDALQVKERFEAFRSGYLIPALRQWREYRHAQLIEFILPALSRYGELKREKSRLNYQDLLMHTAGLLRRNPEVRSYFRNRYTHLLVDEFQDTDPIQAEIMFYLTGQDQNERDWRMLRPRPGSLFVVGDPKQSIYRFRRADIDTYNEVKRLIVAGGGTVLRLTTNFRSVDALGRWANLVFRALLGGGDNRFQAAFEGLDTVRTANGGHHCGIRKISIPRVARHKAGEIARLDAERIAAWISRALAGGLNLPRTEEERQTGLTGRPMPGDFLILMRYKANIDLYAGALESRGIPYRIAGGGAFSQSPELRDLLKLLRSLLDPGDPVRLVAVLRSSLYGISDSQFYRFRHAGGSFHMYSDVPEQLEAGDREIFNWAFAQLRLFRSWTQDLPVGAALEAIVSALGSVPATLTGELGRSRAGRLVQCLELLADAERKGTTSLAGLAECLANLIRVSARVPSGWGAGIEEEINIAPWENDCVRIMNLHKAKGLEAPVVFLANPAKHAPHTPTAHICRTGGSDGMFRSDGTPRGYFVIEKVRGYAREVLGQPPDWDSYCQIEQQYQDAEENRLLYVAATRARDLLVISTYEGNPEISPWSPFEAYLADVPELDIYMESERVRGDEKGIGLSAGARQGIGLSTGDRQRIGLSAADFDKAKADMQAARSAINAASYSSQVPVTSLVRDLATDREATKGSAPSRDATGRGESWGNVIHRLLDVCARVAYGSRAIAGRDGDQAACARDANARGPASSPAGISSHLKALAVRILREEGRKPEEAALALQEVERVLNSPLWERVMSSGLYYTETPFRISGLGTGGFSIDRGVKSGLASGTDMHGLSTGSLDADGFDTSTKTARPGEHPTSTAPRPSPAQPGEHPTSAVPRPSPAQPGEHPAFPAPRPSPAQPGERPASAATYPIEGTRQPGIEACGGGDTILSGTIDLVFKEGDAWVIVDFKTDTVRDERQLGEFVAYYAPQLEMYRQAWESIVGEPVRETGLYFTSINKLVTAKNRLQAETPTSRQVQFLQIGGTTWVIESQV